MSMTESDCYGHRSNISKWVTLGMMQRAEQVRDIAEMLEATMEDLSIQMDNLDEKMALLAETTEGIQEKIEEILDIMNGDVYPDALPTPAASATNLLPF